MTISSAERGQVEEPSISPAMTFLLASACGLIVANLYYGQPLAGLIGTDLGLSAAATGLIVTLTQVGYGLGLLFIVPLGDLVENRKLVVTAIAAAIVALLAAAFAPSAAPFLLAAFFVGMTSVAVQIIVPIAAHMAPVHSRGRVVGNVMSGLMVGIMLARPVSSLLSELISWRGVFVLSAIAMAVLSVVLLSFLPVRKVEAKLSYTALLRSMVKLAVQTKALHRPAVYQALMFATFSLFWTTTPLYLSGPAFGMSQTGIAMFALAGVAGAIAAPIAGRLADRGLSRPAMFAAQASAAVAFAMTHLAPEGSNLGLALLVVAAIVIDFAVTTNLVLVQRVIFSQSAESRSRLNGVCMAVFFTGGAIGSAFGGWIYAHGGWSGASWLGFALPAFALVYSLTKRNR